MRPTEYPSASLIVEHLYRIEGEQPLAADGVHPVRDPPGFSQSQEFVSDFVRQQPVVGIIGNLPHRISEYERCNKALNQHRLYCQTPTQGK